MRLQLEAQVTVANMLLLSKPCQLATMGSTRGQFPDQFWRYGTNRGQDPNQPDIEKCFWSFQQNPIVDIL
jgi:hypothetical protein